LNKVGSRAYATGNPCSGRIYQFDFISFLPDSSGRKLASKGRQNRFRTKLT
jgi:hypothetical protein